LLTAGTSDPMCPSQAQRATYSLADTVLVGLVGEPGEVEALPAPLDVRRDR
jgi:hypothetical protein